MRRDVSHQQHTGRADETLHTLVRLLARAAAHEALAATPRTEDQEHGPSLPSEGNDHAK
ncbi:hypothetical protein SuNHUV7_09530 (plasmid) [Pseudoseohaeicola sp. NH-UV-7]